MNISVHLPEQAAGTRSIRVRSRIGRPIGRRRKFAYESIDMENEGFRRFSKNERVPPPPYETVCLEYRENSHTANGLRTSPTIVNDRVTTIIVGNPPKELTLSWWWWWGFDWKSLWGGSPGLAMDLMYTPMDPRQRAYIF